MNSDRSAPRDRPPPDRDATSEAGGGRTRALDAALATAALLPAVLAPAWFFGRAEVAREVAASDEWRGLAAASGAGGVPGVPQTFEVASGGVDEFGIAREARLVVRDASGAPTPADADLEARVREVSARVASEAGRGWCVRGDGVLLCAVAQAGAVRGAILAPSEVRIPAWGLSAVIVAAAVGVWALGRRHKAGRFPVAVVGGLAGLAGAWLVAHHGHSALRVLSDLEAGVLGTAGTPPPPHAIATGLGFLVACALAAALLCAGLHAPATRLFANLRDRPLVYAAIAPAVVGMTLLIFVPFFMGVYLAFLDNSGRFVGLANFGEILFPTETSDTNFYLTLGVTVLWTALNVGLHVLIGLTLALVLSDAGLRGRAVYRVLLIVPWAVPNYITALIWKWIFNTQYGPANAFLALLGFDPVDWLGRSFWTNFAANLATNTWLGFPFMMVISLGALQSIPAELYEAAKMDGAGRWASFRHVTLPLLKPALFPAVILGTIWTFNMFNVVYLVSGGAPDNQTNILITEAYRAFRVLKNHGLAAAYSLIIFVILAAYTALTNRVTRAAESVYE